MSVLSIISFFTINVNTFFISIFFLKNKKNKYPFANEVEEMKDNLKKMIDSMSYDEFLDFIEYINTCSNISEEDYDEELWTSDEGWEDEAAKFYGHNLDDIEDDYSLPF